MKNKCLFCLSILLVISLLLASCNPTSTPDTSQPSSSSQEASSQADESSQPIPETNDDLPDVEYTNKDLTSSYSTSSAIKIHLSDDASTVTGSGATVDGNTIIITSSGDYLIDGRLSDGQIYVNLTVKGSVRLILNGAEITNTRSAAIFMVNVTKSVITLADNTTNTFTDAVSYFYDTPGDNEPNACIFSKGDITINGEGTLNVNGRYNNGIQSKDELKIISGTVNVTANNNALKGKDFVAIKGGTINLTADDDGIQSDNIEDQTLGFIQIDGGDITINAGDEGIQAETYVKIKNGTLNITSGGDAIKAQTLIQSQAAIVNITTR